MSRPRHGFTLIELLVVISIIALLIAMLLPALGGARQAGQNVVCQSNNRSLGFAASMHFEDTQRLIQSTPGDTGRYFFPQSFFGNMYEAVKDTDHDVTGGDFTARSTIQRLYTTMGVGSCPTAPSFVGATWHAAIVPNGGFNRQSTSQITAGPLEFNGNFAASSYVLYGDGNGVGILPEGQTLTGVQASAGYHKPMFRHYSDLQHNEMLNGTAGGTLANRGNGRANFTMSDGHVESIAVEDYADAIADEVIVIKDMTNTNKGW